MEILSSMLGRCRTLGQSSSPDEECRIRSSPPHLQMTTDPNYQVPTGSPWQPDQISSTSRMKPKVKLNSRPATVAMYCLPFSWQCSGISLKSPLVSSMTTIHAAGHSSCPQTIAM